LEPGTLSTFAEVGIALAGFSGVVVALGRRALGEWVPVDRLRSTTLVTLSLLLVVFSLLPLVLEPLDLSELTSLRLCNGLFAAGHASVVYSSVIRLRQFRAAGETSTWARLSIGAGVIACQAFASVGASLPASQFIYLAALTWVLAMGVIDFGLLLLPPTDRNGA
jgi:hypothetical protein